MKGSFKTALIAAVVSAFVAAGAAVATTKTFVLGTTNTVDAASTVTAGSGLNTKMLQLTNNSMGSSATALGLTTASTRPPMIVSSQARVANLNADKLDGIDSSGYVQGRGKVLATRVVFAPLTNEVLLAIPGLGVLRAACSNAADISWVNDTGGPVDVWHDLTNSHFDAEVAPHGTGKTLVFTSAGINGGTVALGVGDDPGPRRTALLHVFALQSAPGTPCGFQVQGTLWTS